MTMIIRPLVKIFGGKHYLKNWIIDNFPSNYENMNYVEPYIGGGSVFLNKKPSTIEVINDIDDGLISIWRDVHSLFSIINYELSQLKYNEETFNNAKNGKYLQSINEYVLYRMSRSGMKKNFAWSERQRGGKPGDINAWETAIRQLPLIHERLKRTIILHAEAMTVLDNHNSPTFFAYLDPPYLDDTRVSKKVYNYEMAKKAHIELLMFLREYKGKVLISGYDNYIYNDILDDWNKVEKSIVNNASQQKQKPIKVEVLWRNY